MLRNYARILPCILALGFLTQSGLVRADETANAITERRSGVDVYLLSRPARAYDVLDSGKTVVLFDCNEMINKPIKKAADKRADGVIIYFETGRFEIIKYR